MSALMLLLGLAVIGLSILPPDTLQLLVGRWGEGGSIGPAVTAKIAMALRGSGCLAIALGGALWWTARSCSARLVDEMSFLRTQMGDARRAFSRACREDRVYVWALLLVVGVGFYVRWFYLDRPMSVDESVTFMAFARRPWYIGLSDYFEPNNHVLHTFLVHCATRWCVEPQCIRLPAFVAGLLTIPLTYGFVRSVYSREVGLIAAAMVATSAAMVDYSTDARGYTLLIVFMLTAWWCAIGMVRGVRGWPWIGWLVCSALGFFTVPVFLYPFGVILLWMGLTVVSRPWREVRRFIIAAAIASVVVVGLTTLLYTPILVFSGPEKLLANPRVEPRNTISFLQRLPGELHHIWNYYHLAYPRFVPAVFGLLAVLALFKGKSIGRFSISIGIPLLIACLTLLLLQRRIPSGGFARSWLFVVPIYAALVSAGFVWVIKRLSMSRPRFVTPVVLLLTALITLGMVPRVTALGWITGFSTLPAPTHYEDEDITRFLKEHLQSGDRLLVNSLAGTFHYYFYRHGLDMDAVYGDVEAAGDLYVLIKPDRRYQPYVDQVLSRQATRYDEPVLLQHFEYGELYWYRRLQNMSHDDKSR